MICYIFVTLFISLLRPLRNSAHSVCKSGKERGPIWSSPTLTARQAPTEEEVHGFLSGGLGFSNHVISHNMPKTSSIFWPTLEKMANGVYSEMVIWVGMHNSKPPVCSCLTVYTQTLALGPRTARPHLLYYDTSPSLTLIFNQLEKLESPSYVLPFLPLLFARKLQVSCY